MNRLYWVCSQTNSLVLVFPKISSMHLGFLKDSVILSRVHNFFWATGFKFIPSSFLVLYLTLDFGSIFSHLTLSILSFLVSASFSLTKMKSGTFYLILRYVNVLPANELSRLCLPSYSCFKIANQKNNFLPKHFPCSFPLSGSTSFGKAELLIKVKQRENCIRCFTIRWYST